MPFKWTLATRCYHDLFCQNPGASTHLIDKADLWAWKICRLSRGERQASWYSWGVRKILEIMTNQSCQGPLSLPSFTTRAQVDIPEENPKRTFRWHWRSRRDLARTVGTADSAVTWECQQRASGNVLGKGGPWGVNRYRDTAVPESAFLGKWQYFSFSEARMKIYKIIRKAGHPASGWA